MRVYDKITGALGTILGYIAGGATLVMMLHMVADAVARTVFRQPIEASNEYVQYWYMVMIGIAGWGLAQMRGQHIDAPIIFDRINPKIQPVWRIIAYVATIFFMIAVAYSGWVSATHAMEIGEFAGGYGTLIWPMKFLIPISAVLFGLIVLSELIKEIKALVRPDKQQIPVDDEIRTGVVGI